MIDNINNIKPLLNFEKEGDFYQCMIMIRKKDQPIGERDNHQSVRTVKTYCIESIDYMENRYNEIKQLCEYFKARCYIHINKQNHKDVSLSLLSELAKRIQTGIHNQKHIFESVVGQLKTYEKRWIVDVDNKDDEYINKMLQDLSKLKPEGDKVESIIPTRNGYHLITKRFDTMTFKKEYPSVDIVKKNPTLLYYPNSLD